LPKHKTDGALALTSFDTIFNTDNVDASGERVTELPLDELFPPDFHPFLILDDQAMDRLVKSVKQYGVREPGLARPRAEGGYELLSGNRRKHACELAGIDVLPVIVRELDDDEAAIAMVDSNLEQREKLLYYEKAWAYRLKLEALNHRGAKSDNPGQLSVEILCEQTGESKNNIFRLVRLTELVPDLMDMLDAKKLAFIPAVDVSYLTRAEQAWVVDCMAKYQAKPSQSQAQRLKRASQEKGLTYEAVDAVFAEPKKKADKTQDGIRRFQKFFPESYTSIQIEAVINELLTGWQAGQAAGGTV